MSPNQLEFAYLMAGLPKMLFGFMTLNQFAPPGSSGMLVLVLMSFPWTERILVQRHHHLNLQNLFRNATQLLRLS